MPGSVTVGVTNQTLACDCLFGREVSRWLYPALRPLTDIHEANRQLLASDGWKAPPTSFILNASHVSLVIVPFCSVPFRSDGAAQKLPTSIGTEQNGTITKDT